MKIDNFTYSKVKLLANSNHYLISENSTIDIIYYDFNYGIRGFDDTVNDEYFRLVAD